MTDKEIELEAHKQMNIYTPEHPAGFVHGYMVAAKPREKRIKELEQKLEQTEKDLADYQFNYPKIKELQQENAELKNKIEHKNCLDCSNHHSNIKLLKAKEILREYIRINLLPPIERNFDDEVKLFKQAEQFLEYDKMPNCLGTQTTSGN